MSKQEHIMGIMMVCVFKRESDSPWEAGIMLDEGAKGYLDRFGNLLDNVWEAKNDCAFMVDFAPILKHSQDEVERWEARRNEDIARSRAFQEKLKQEREAKQSPAMKEEQARIINGKTPQVKRPATCIIEGCLNKANAAKGLCHKHYGRKRRKGNTDDPDRVNKGKICSVEGCKKDAREKGMCIRHSRRVETHGDPHTVTKPYTYNGQECLIQGCSERPIGHGLCNKHYANYKYHIGVNVNSIEEYVVKKSEGEI